MLKLPDIQTGTSNQYPIEGNYWQKRRYRYGHRHANEFLILTKLV